MPPFDCSLKQTQLSKAEMHRYFPDLVVKSSESDPLNWESIFKAITEAVDFKMLFIMGSLLVLLFLIVLFISCRKPKRKSRLINRSKDETPSREFTLPPVKLNDNTKSNRTSESNSQTLSSDYMTESIDDPYSLLSY